MDRRNFLTFLSGTTIAAIALPFVPKGHAVGLFSSEKKQFPYALSEAEWRKKLSPEAFYVLREEGTERSQTSSLDTEKRNGIFHCAGCHQACYHSNHKFDSGTGWPSFYQPITEDAVETTTDYKLIYPRTEVHCSNCGGHHGHVFKDGPQPTGLRYCINGVALEFRASS